MDLSAQNRPIRRKPRRIRLSRYGWGLVFLLFWIPLAALFTANNFLLIVFILMIGLIAVSHKLARRNIDSVRFTRHFPEEIYAQTPFSIRYALDTDHKWWGSMTLGFQEEPPLEDAGQGVFFSRIPWGESVEVHGFFTISTRGDKRIGHGTLHSSFPFGLADYFVEAGDSASVLVFPKVERVDDQVPIHLGGYGRGVEQTDPFGTIPYLFRDYVPGDPYKRIDWKKTAQSGNLVTRVFSEEGARDITIRLPRNASEEAISRAASLVVHFARTGTPISLHGPGLAEGPGRGKGFTKKLLTLLARWHDEPENEKISDTSSGILVEIDRSGECSWIQGGNRDEQERRHSG